MTPGCDTVNTASPHRSTGKLRATALLVCTLLITLFAINAWRAVSDKSATFDEVVHAPAAYSHLRYNDFRMNTEHPPLWKYWAAIPWLFDPPADDRLNDPEYATQPSGWIWSQNLLYHTPANDGRHLIAQSRFFMLLIGICVCGLGAWFAWRASGPIAAMITTALLSFDPNLLAHSPLVTNDVSYTLVTLAIVFCLWQCSQHITRTRIIMLCLLCAAAITTKFNGVLFAPIVMTVLLVRAFASTPWPLGNKSLDTHVRRFAAVVGICFACAITSFFLLWAAYGFRYSLTADSSFRPDMNRLVVSALTNRIHARTGAIATPQQIASEPQGVTLSVLQFADEHQLLPEAFLTGMCFVYANSFNRLSFFLGQTTGGANPLYFPVAFLVKTPIATLAMIAVAIAGAISTFNSRTTTPLPSREGLGEGAGDDPIVKGEPARISPSTASGGEFASDALAASENSIASQAAPNPSSAALQPLWPALLIPLAIIAIASILSPLNIGVRHILPIYPLIYVAVGVIGARLIALHRRLRWIVLALVSILAIETCSVFPNYLSYFNVAVGGSRGGARILGDSNLDWGQDLPALARWQAAHPDRPLALAYFGMAEPAYFGVKADILALGTDFSHTHSPLPTTGVVAVSHMMLHATWMRDEDAAFFKSLREREPIEVLGGSIYLFELEK